MKNSPPTFRRLCAALLLTMATPWASGQAVQTLMDINATPVTESTDPDELTQAAGTLFISTDNALSGSELWKFTVLAAFRNARGVTVDAAGVVYVADTGNHVIRKITADGVVTTIAGAVGMTGNVDGTGLAARFTSPEGIAVVTGGPHVGTLFVADTGNHTIRRISPEGSVSTLAGGVSGTNGLQGYVNNANPSDARFRSPRGVAVYRLPTGSNLEVYVADSGNHAIRKIEILTASSAVTTLAGAAPDGGGNGVPGDAPRPNHPTPTLQNQAIGTLAAFNNPGGLALDNVIDVGTGRPTLYVADTNNNKIRRLSLGGTVTTMAGSGAVGSANGNDLSATFNAPQSVTCNANTDIPNSASFPTPSLATSAIFVADTGNQVIRRIQANTRAVTTLAGAVGVTGSANGVGAAANFDGLRSLAFRGLDVIAADSGNSTLRTVVSSGTGVGTVTLRAGQVGVLGDGDGASLGTATPAPVQLKDIVPGENGSLPQELTTVGTSVFFTAQDVNGDRKLWKSDGTTAGTFLVNGSQPQNDPGNPQLLRAVGNTVFFQGENFAEGAELWTSDGSALGTTLVKDINPGTDGSLMETLFNAGGTLLLGASNGVNGVEMWRSNGTGAGTFQVADMFTGSVGSNPSSYLFFDGAYYLVLTSDLVEVGGSGQAVGRELFTMSTGFAPPTLVEDLDGLQDSEPRELVFTGPDTKGTVAGVGGQMFFTASTSTDGRELYVMNLDNNMVPTQVRNLNSTAQDSGIEHLTPITVTTGNPARPHRVLFVGDDGAGQGLELFSSDGTVIGTGLVKDVTPGDAGSVLDNFIPLSAGLVVFVKHNTADQTVTLWRTDGTDAGTAQIENFATEGVGTPSLTSMDFRAPVRVGANLYFMLGHDELWVTNGQDDIGTRMVHRFRTSTASSESRDFVRLADGRMIFSSNTPAAGREPWIYDPAFQTTAMLSDMRTGTDGSEPEGFTATNDGRAFFSAATGGGDRELYMTDGITVAPVQEINPFGSSDPENFFWNNGKLYFAATDNASNVELWVLTSPPEGGSTLANIEINLSENGSFPDHFVAYKDMVYFAAETNAGVELWRTNGTTVFGTAPFKDIATGTQSSMPDEFVVMPPTGLTSKLYFIATGSGNGVTAAQETGRELWVTDGTAANTKVVKDIIPGSVNSIDDSFPAYLTLVSTATNTHTLFFVADDGTNGRELWKSDGTQAGTVMVTNLNKITTIGDANEGSNPTDLRSVNGKLFFIANDGINGRELWVSNGTASGTVMVNAPGRTGLVNGIADAGIQDLTVISDVVTFTADDGNSGREVWISDGNSAGTYLLADFVPGVGSSYPHDLAAIGSQLVFSASDEIIGDEPRQAFLASKLVVEQPVGNPLANGVSIVDFTPVMPVAFGASTNLVIRLKNVGTTGIKNIVASLGGLHAADFIITKKPNPTLSKDTFTEVTVQFKPREGGERSASLLISSTDGDNPLFTVLLSGDCTKDPTVTLQPVHKMVKVGQPVTLTSTAVGTNPISIQWRKNGGPVAGATSNPLYLWAAKLTDAGAYTAQFKSSTTPAGTAITDNAQVGVAEDYVPARIVPVKNTANGTKLTVNAAGNNLTYVWKFSASPALTSPQTLTTLVGFNTKTVTLTGTQTSGYYFCEVTGPGGTVIGGTTQLKVFTTTPVATPVAEFPVGIVGSAYFYQIQVDPDPTKAPTTFAAAPLPGGLKIDTKTGVISGIPTKAETKSVVVKVSNGLPTATSVSTFTADLTVINLPTGLDGVFQGLVERDEEINGSAGGRIEVITTKAGSYSGKLIMGATTYPFKGNLMFGVDTMQDPPVAIPPFSAMVRIPRTGILAPLDLSFTIDGATKDRFSAAQIDSINSGGVVSAAVSGWKVTTNISRYYVKGMSPYNFGLRLPAMVNAAPNPNLNNPAVPQGDGYGTFLVSDKGALTIAGMTADNEKITCATFVGPNGEVLLYQSLYATTRKGSVCGLLNLSAGANVGGTLADLEDNVITSVAPFDWTRPPTTAVLAAAPATRTYRAGFGLADTPVTTPVELEAFGGYYKPGAHLLQVVAGDNVTDRANLLFTGAGVDLPSLEPDLTTIAINVSTAKVLGVSPAKTKFSKTDLKTGLFAGSFALADDDTSTATVKANEITRTVNFLGLIVPDGGNHRGVGYFMLPQIPPAANATPWQKAPILSGKVNFDND